jgi:hypothetical protein
MMAKKGGVGHKGLRRLVGGSAVLLSFPCFALYAQSPAIDDIKGKLFDAHMAQKTFAGGLPHCGELDGQHFYFQPRDRVLDLEEYHRSLENLVRQQVFNPEKRRPWTQDDAAVRWEQVKQQAVRDKAACDLVASLPALEKKLEELEKKSGAADTK